jgi:hypothetical protein
MTHPEKTVRALLWSNIASWAALLILLFAAFRSGDPNSQSKDLLRVTEIDAERINIIGTNGRPVMAISNRAHIPGPTFEGKEYPQSFGDGRDQYSGIIFFNEEGDEVGGLIYNGFPQEDGYSAVGHFSFDQWKQNQVVALQYVDNGTSRRAGVRVWDRPTDYPFGDFLDLGLARMETESYAVRDSLRAEHQKLREAGALGVERLFLGSRDEEAQLEMRDAAGRVRLRLIVDAENDARLEFLDPEGRVTSTYPQR